MTQKNIIKNLWLAGALGLPLVASAQTYRQEAQIEYVTGEIEADDFEVNDDNFTLRYRFYFTEVDQTGVRALYEAPFISRSSSIYGELGVGEIDEDEFFSIEEDHYAIGGRFVNAETGWFMEADYGNSRKDVDAFGEGLAYRPEYDAYGLAVGKYLSETSTLAAVLTTTDFDNSDYGTDFQALERNATIGLDYRLYWRLGNQMANSFDISYHFVDQNAEVLGDLDSIDEVSDGPFDNNGQIWTAAYNFYPAPEWKLGVSYADTDELGGQPFFKRSVEQLDGLAFTAQWYATNNWSIAAVYNRSDYDVEDDFPFESEGDVHEDYLTLRTTFRF